MAQVVNGATNRAHYEAAAKHSARARKRLVDPEIPAGCAHVWIWFCELNEVRGGTAGAAGYIPHPIGYADIAAWARLTRRELTPIEVAMLRSIDRLWLATRDDEEESA